MIGLVCPTRGTIFTQVLESIEQLRARYGISLYLSDNLPTPDAFNVLTAKAIDDDMDYILYVEEDTVPPKHCIEKMLAVLDDTKVGAVAVPYFLGNGQSTIVRHAFTKEILYCGLGCTLIRTKTLLLLPQPWFRSDRAFRLNSKQWEYVDPTKQYGLYDVYFFSLLRKLGYSIKAVDLQARHIEIKVPATKEQNGSLHCIQEKNTQAVPSYISIDPKEYL